MTSETKAKKPARTKLDLVDNSAEFVAIVQQECRSRQYDIKKIMTRFNCPRPQAVTLVPLAQIEDGKAKQVAKAQGR